MLECPILAESRTSARSLNGGTRDNFLALDPGLNWNLGPLSVNCRERGILLFFLRFSACFGVPIYCRREVVL